ncbi:DNA mismatch repair protein [Pedobacter sp. KBW06]|uniref:MutS-related protein n=1 Tax=Pedobacter sp. KBW06 TaxID=2153359 RepID=UPI000F59252F|nr:DNA mismatch repair protein [Pedobacter sp. KBW06]RQO75636.1 DNA mismatch repair protein [Pedobacter sp. KBW06]
MSFTTDKQTLNDLNIFGQHGRNSIYTLFNQTHTRGGADLLEEMFRYPLSNVQGINTRSSIIQYFQSVAAVFPFSGSVFEAAEHYLSHTDQRSRLSLQNNNLGSKFNNLISINNDYKVIYTGIVALIEMFNILRHFLKEIPENEMNPYYKERIEIQKLLEDQEFAVLFRLEWKNKIQYSMMVKLDGLLRYSQISKVKSILKHIYQLDVYISVANIALKRGFVFAKALQAEYSCIILEGVFHPELNNAVPNNLIIAPEGNVIFLTGANMAGKSTFMKSLGIALFLAHMGFPVPARRMEFSVLNGIYTTINLPDSLSMGASHFYVEVLRLKKIALELNKNKSLLVIFDELFRGTNVKDAYDATIAITGAFAQKRNSMFVVSTHIVEAAEVLKEQFDNIDFQYLPTRMNQNIPEYTYTLEFGITADRHGMIILQNEGVIDILKKKQTKGS